ncbi:hypothetical protein C1631_009810 [Chryseobacterium phosphatilyticum]|uniref:Uncharacterized protein n=1 Tax=Chryseobacterium phosphatilyticum TaxID=475075 RepID=A0A316XFS5_9FLAO|nr:hypothetical protein [Chryseobacterium phosphatilyticum]PWN70268.1 hypothetical protein C1631_009810 [Chryseobacterium phosphatilyticum]
MKNIFKNTTLILTLLVIAVSLNLTSCNRSDDEADDLPQEELSNILLKVTDEATPNTPVIYDYQVNSTSNPNVKLVNGHTYNVEVIFKNGDEDATNEIKTAKDEHFLVYNFPNSDIALTRTDDSSSTRGDGKHVGLKTKWVVNTAIKNPAATSTQLILTLYHEPKTVSEASATSGNGVVYGQQSGGETDAQATYNLNN